MRLFRRCEHDWYITTVKHMHYSLMLVAMEDPTFTEVWRHCHKCSKVKRSNITGWHEKSEIDRWQQGPKS